MFDNEDRMHLLIPLQVILLKNLVVKSHSSNAEKPSTLAITSEICSRQSGTWAKEMALSSIFWSFQKTPSLATLKPQPWKTCRRRGLRPFTVDYLSFFTRRASVYTPSHTSVSWFRGALLHSGLSSFSSLCEKSGAGTLWATTAWKGVEARWAALLKSHVSSGLAQRVLFL